MRFVADMCLIYIPVLFMYRKGIRTNNTHEILAARLAFAPIFYCTNMRTYMGLNYRDLLLTLKAPPHILQFIQNHEAFSEIGSSNKRGGDFILENKNRRTNMWAPPGVPSDAQWQQICRTLDKLEEVIIQEIVYYKWCV